MREVKDEIVLNYQTYPLVVGNSDKYTFSNWESCGSMVPLEAYVKDRRYSSQDIIWEVQDESIAVVKSGLVRAKTTGFTRVKASLPSGAAAYCEISVIDNITRSTTLWIELSTEHLILKKGEHADILVFLYPEDVLENGAMNRNVIFESLNKAVAEADQQGNIYAVSEGITEIRVTSEDVGRKASCQVQVISEQCTENDDTGNISWKSSNPYIASVNAQGEVTEHSVGDVEIYETAVWGGKRKAVQLSVKSPELEAEKVFLSKSNIYISLGEQQSIYGLASPATCSLPHFQWEISDQEIAEIVSVEENDFGAEEISIRGVKEGSAVIKASYKGKTAVCTVHVSEKKYLNQLYIEADRTLQIEEVYQLELKFEKGTFQNKLFWLSSNRECVSVNQEGIIKAYAPGNIKIFCISGDNLTTEEKYQLWEMSRVRKLEQDPYRAVKLKKILEHAVYAESNIEIKEETKQQCCLRNLHIVKEAITSDSIMLLWNRASLPYTGDFSEYLVTWKKKDEQAETHNVNRIRTGKLGYTAAGLEPETDYVFRVDALSVNEKVLHSQFVHARTRKRMEVIDVTKKPYCAVGNGKTIDTFAIQKAIDECPVNGTVLLPSGYIFYSGALFLKSNITFQVEGTLIGSTDPKDYPPVVTRWEGWRKIFRPADRWPNSSEAVPDNKMAHASLINAGVYDEGKMGIQGPFHIENIMIKGHGMINGNGFKLGYNEGPNHYDIDGGLPVPFSTKSDPNIRGRAITIHNGRNICIKDVTVCYSPSWTIHTIYCDHVTFDHITVISKGTGKTGASDDICILNGDGIDPDSSTNVNIFDSFFFTGDDAVAIKSGRDREGNELNKPSAYLRITDCASVGSKGGFCIGSEQAGGAHDILWQNLLVKDVILFGLWIKASTSRGGLVQDILWKDCILDGTQGGVFLEDKYHGSGINPARVLPEICHNTFENIQSKKHKDFGVRINGLEDGYIHDIILRDSWFEEILSDREEAFEITCGQNIVLQNIKIPAGYDWSTDEVSTVLTDHK